MSRGGTPPADKFRELALQSLIERKLLPPGTIPRQTYKGGSIRGAKQRRIPCNFKLAHLTKDLELTPKQQQQVRPLLQEHHDKVQVLLDKNPKASRQELAPQIHAISDETHRQIHAVLTDHQKDLEKAMQEREHGGEENRRREPPRRPQLEPSSGPSDHPYHC